MEFLASVPSLLWSLLMIAVFFGGSIFVHELGHFLVARRRGLKVERFSIGFGPKLFGWRGKDGVDYRLSWLPLGGYVALPQLADMRAIEGEAAEELKNLPPPSYATKMLVFVAGAACNVLFAFALACVVWFVGQPTDATYQTTRVGVVLPTLKLPDGSTPPSPASQAGLKPGDTILAIDGAHISNWSELQQTLFAGTGRTPEGGRRAELTIKRDGEVSKLVVHPLLAGDEEVRMIGVAPFEELFVARVLPDTLAAAAGFQPDDRIVSVDGLAITHSSLYVQALEAAPASPAQVVVERAGTEVTLFVGDRSTLKPAYDLGVDFKPTYLLIHPAPWTQLYDDAVMTYRTLVGLIHPKSDLGVSKLSGPVGIARIFHLTAQIDIRLVLWFTVLINVNLAIFNLLPIPVLDGGHMLFATIGRLRGRALPAQFIATVQGAFMVLLFSMILYVTFFDVRRIARDRQPAAPAEDAAPAAK